MPLEKAALRVTELDFDSIRNNLKNYLRSQSEFTDYDFEGSGMAILLDILAYNTHYMGYYLNMVGNEMFLDTAQIRSSVLSHAKAINYIPGSKKGALAKVNVIVTPSENEDQDLNILTIDKYTRLFATDKDGINHQFVTLYSNTATKSANGAFIFPNIMIKQGEVITLQYLADSQNERRRYDIPSANVDTETIVVSVQESYSNTYTQNFTQAQDITTLAANSRVYFLEENEELKYSLYFGDNILGKKPKDGNIIIVTYLDNIGEVSNNISKFVFAEAIAGQFSDNVKVICKTSSYGGVDKETVEQVRFRAPYFYTTQNRAVTTLDYETLLMKDYNFIEAISAWGGEDNDPVVYGKVYLSIKTKGNFALTNFEKERIKSNLIKNRNILTVIPEIIDPDYVYVTIRGQVNYNPSLTSLTSNQILERVRAAISNYAADELNTFRSVFRKSKLQNYIENADPSIVGSDITTYIQKRVELDVLKAKEYGIKFNLTLQKGDLYTSMYTSPQVSVVDYNGVTRYVNFEEIPSSATGIDNIIVTNPGFNYFTAPKVTILGDGSGAAAYAVVRNGRISNIVITNRGSNYTRASILITSEDGRGGEALALLESRFGLLRTYYYKEDGEKVLLNTDAGTVDYDQGSIVLRTFRSYGTQQNDFYDKNIFTLNFPLEKEIILPLRNRIISIDPNDPLSIQLEVVAES